MVGRGFVSHGGVTTSRAVETHKEVYSGREASGVVGSAFSGVAGTAHEAGSHGQGPRVAVREISGVAGRHEPDAVTLGVDVRVPEGHRHGEDGSPGKARGSA